RRDQLHDAALLFIPREFGQQRDVWQECFSLGARLSEKGDLLLLEPVGVLSGDRSKAESAALDLAALHAEIDILGSPIADHDLEPGPEQVVHDSGDDDNPRSCAGTAKDDLLFPRLLDRLNPSSMPDQDHLILWAGRTEPIEFVGVIAHALAIEHLV